MADLVESIHMLYAQITLDDDTQMTIRLAASMMLRLYSSVRSDSDTALTLLQIDTKCLKSRHLLSALGWSRRWGTALST